MRKSSTNNQDFNTSTRLGKRIFVFIVLIIVLALVAIYLINTYNKIEVNNLNYTTSKLSTHSMEDTVEKVQSDSTIVADVLENTTEKVVGISKLKNTGNSILSSNNEGDLGLGTGFIVSADGYIVSNEHVTGSKYSVCYITLENGQNYNGTVVWSNSDLDLSITKINAKDLPFVSLGDSSKIRIGETVYAIGNPIGFEFRRTVTSGIISAKNRSVKIEEDNNISYMTSLIQTDATINPGNSGGPLIYPNGEIIGVNTVKITSAEGIGFAVPINVISPILDSYKNTGDFQEATVGIYAYDKDIIPYMNSDYSYDDSQNIGSSIYSNLNFDNGIYVAQITKNGPCDKTELKVGDIITAIDNISLSTMNDLRQYIYSKSPGDEVVLKVTRGKINKQISVTLGQN